MTADKSSIIDMAMGAIKKQVDYAMAHVIDNIIDPNTNPTKKRSIVITIDIAPDGDRQNLFVSSTVKSKLEPTSPVVTALCITGDEDGIPTAIEMTPQIPGQVGINGREQPPPVMLNLIREGQGHER